MSKIKLIISILIFSFLLSATSILKTQTRIIEKKIYNVENKIQILKKDLHETQLDFSYVSSPGYLSNKINELNIIEYVPLDHSRIYLDFSDFINEKNKVSTLKVKDEKEIQKK